MKEFFDVNNCFLWIAIIWAIIFGFYSVFGNLFGVILSAHEEIINGNKILVAKRKIDWIIHQIFFNGLGAFIGWIVVYYLWREPISTWGIQHFIALSIAFVGVTGYLPKAASYFGKI